MEHEERIALYLDFENLALGARDHLGSKHFNFRPIADALADRGRVVVRKAYADWSYFDKDRRDLTRHHVELIEIPQRMGASRKNAADIKLAVDALELAFERPYVTTFVIGTGDSDFTPLVHKLRELDKRVIGIGVRGSTSKLLPPACDEFLFYDRLDGIDEYRPSASRPSTAEPKPAVAEDDGPPAPTKEPEELVMQTIAGIGNTGDVVRASVLKRAIMRKDPTFTEADLGFRNFTEMLRSMADRKLVSLTGADRDPDVELAGDEAAAQHMLDLLSKILDDAKGKPLPLAGLKTELRKRDPEFSERRLGYGSFLQFCRAAAGHGAIALERNADDTDYVVTKPA